MYLILLFLLAPLSAFAAESSSPVSSALSWLASPTGIIALLGVAGFLLGSAEVRRRRVALAIYHAFHVVEDVNAEFEPGDTGSKLDKVRLGLKAADDWMVANGWRPLKPGEQDVAKLGFRRLNGEAEEAAAIQAKAMTQAKELGSPS